MTQKTTISFFTLAAATNLTVNDDSYSGTVSADNVDGLAGDDILYGLDGDDTLNGNAGDDFLYGGSGNDTLISGSGDDQLFGGSGNDTLVATVPPPVTAAEQTNTNQTTITATGQTLAISLTAPTVTSNGSAHVEGLVS
ncbi:MAG: calcium-binding protein, partial [Candidatus Methylumidiphilus sp.]